MAFPVSDSAVTDEQLRTALESAHLPSLLPALGLLSGDWQSQRAVRPSRYRVTEAQGGMTPELQTAARKLAFVVLRRFFDGQLGEARTDEGAVLEGLRPLLGDDFDAYRDMSLEELAIVDEDPRAPKWRMPRRPASDILDVVVIGAGMSGLLAAHRLKQAGVEFTVLEKNPDVGGTWYENTYPGCRVDVPSHLYSYSCLGDHDWASTYAAQDEVRAGFVAFADRNGLLENLRFGSEVVAASFEESWGGWTVTVRTAQGEHVLNTRVLVSAVGQLNRPSIPAISGRERFRGPQVHSGAWDASAPLDGRRYGVVGSGASAVQVVTGLLDRGARVYVFQRTPAWLFPTPELRQPIDEGQRWLLRVVPTYARWYRLWLHRSVSDGLLPFSERDPVWDDPRSVSALNDRVRQVLTAYLEEQFGDVPELHEQMLPSYPPFAKRVIRDDGSWAAGFKGGGATLVSDAIVEVTERGIRTHDGIEHELDGIVWATGFQASRFLAPMRITGRGGLDLHEHWAGDPNAYLGTAVSGFPNLFMLYGPNTNIVLNGSIIFFSECQVTYLLDAVRHILATDGSALDCRPEVQDRFCKHVDEMNARRAWSYAGVSNWYRSDTGRISQNWPGTVLEYWERTRAFDPTDYQVIRSSEGRAVA